MDPAVPSKPSLQLPVARHQRPRAGLPAAGAYGHASRRLPGDAPWRCTDTECPTTDGLRLVLVMVVVVSAGLTNRLTVVAVTVRVVRSRRRRELHRQRLRARAQHLAAGRACT